MRIVKDFLSIRLKKGAKLLLALSGGSDSLALLHLLIECRASLDFDLHIAHIDHGWREESLEEAKILEKLARSLRLPFHLHILKEIPDKDRENQCRIQRLQFFSTLHKQYHFQALLLAHHADDQAETVLKRICEGASWRGLGGLLEEKEIDGLPIWRPLLSVRKKRLETYLSQKHLTPFQDKTNLDPAYLRGRMRSKIFPDLEVAFGKQIGNNLVKLGHFFSGNTCLFR